MDYPHTQIKEKGEKLKMLKLKHWRSVVAGLGVVALAFAMS